MLTYLIYYDMLDGIYKARGSNLKNIKSDAKDPDVIAIALTSEDADKIALDYNNDI